jgi:hypothetical protein
MSFRRTFTLLVGVLVATSLALPAGAKSKPVTKIKFKLDSHEMVVGDDVTGTVKVCTHTGHPWDPFPGATLSVRVDGDEVGTVVTDANGEADIVYAGATEGDHVMKVVFAGDDTHKRAQRAQGFTVAASTEPTVPEAPVLSATAGAALVSLSWTVPAEGASAITGYNVYRGTASGGEALLVSGVAGTTYADTTAVSGTTYYYQVTAVNAEGEGARSNEVSATPT